MLKNKLGMVLALSVLVLVPNFVVSMIITPEVALQRMRDAGNVYNGLLSIDETLNNATIFNPFWTKLQQSSAKQEVQNALATVTQASPLLPWVELRRHLAAAFLVGATVDSKQIVQGISLDDWTFVSFFLQHIPRAAIQKPRRQVPKPIYFARTVPMAHLLCANGAKRVKNLHTVMAVGYSPELIPFYVAQQTNPQATEIRYIGSMRSEVTPFHQLIESAAFYGDFPYEALKKAALLKEANADLATVHLVELNITGSSVVQHQMSAYIGYKINELADKHDENSMKHKKVLELLSSFLQKPKSYRDVCIQEYAGNRSIFSVLCDRQLGKVIHG